MEQISVFVVKNTERHVSIDLQIETNIVQWPHNKITI